MAFKLWSLVHNGCCPNTLIKDFWYWAHPEFSFVNKMTLFSNSWNVNCKFCYLWNFFVASLRALTCNFVLLFFSFFHARAYHFQSAHIVYGRKREWNWGVYCIPVSKLTNCGFPFMWNCTEHGYWTAAFCPQCEWCPGLPRSLHLIRGNKSKYGDFYGKKWL